MSADEIQHGAEALALGPPQPTAELLQKQGGALGRAQHEQGVHRGHVDTLVEEIHREDDADLACREVFQGGGTIVRRTVPPDGDRRHVVFVEVIRHEFGVFDADAEAESAHRGGIVGKARYLLHHRPRPGVGTGVHVAQRLDVITLAPTPRNLGQVESVVDAVVHERAQPLLVDGIPEPKFGGDAVVEPMQDRQIIAAFGSRCQPQEFAGLDVVEQPPIRRGRGMVELIDDDDVEVIGREVLQVAGVQALHRGEDVLEVVRSCTADPFLAEGSVPDGVPEGGQALIQDLITVCDEQQTRPGQFTAQAGVVDGGHDGLTGAGGRHQQIAVPTAAPSYRDLLQQSLLEGFQAKFDRAEDDLRSGVDPARSAALGFELRGIERDEIGALPVAFEDSLKLGEDVGVAGSRGTDVPLQSGDLCGMGEVGGADVCGGEAAAAVEDPRLGVQPGGADIVGDTYLRTQVCELLKGGLLGGSGVDGGEDPQRFAAFAVPAQRADERIDTAAADEGHQHVNLIGRVDLGVELMKQARLPG